MIVRLDGRRLAAAAPLGKTRLLTARLGRTHALAATLLLLPISAQGAVWPTSGWQSATPASMGMSSATLEQARDYALTHGGGSGIITRGGLAVMSWGSPTATYELKSATKSIGAMLLGIAVQDGLVALTDRAQDHLADFGTPPLSNASTGWLDDITLQILATHTGGFEKTGGFGTLLHAPANAWTYSDGGANWIADVLTVRYGQDLRSVLESRVLTHLGVTSAHLTWRDNVYRGTTIQGIPRREFGSGISASVDAMARLGYLHLRQGTWDGTVILNESFVDAARAPVPGLGSIPVSDPATYPNASSHYGLLWWNNGDGAIPGVPSDAYWAWGLGESIILVIPSLDIVAARAGGAWQEAFRSDYSVIAPFFSLIVQSTGNQPPTVSAGANRSITLPQTSLVLDGSASDDGFPSGGLTTSWSVESGPGAVAFDDPSILAPVATFSTPGVYVLALSASDGELATSDQVQVTVYADPPPPPPGALFQSYLSFDGAGDFAKVSDPGAGPLDLAASFTVSAWVRFESLPATGEARNPRIVQKGASTGDAGSYYLSVKTQATPVLSLRLKFSGTSVTLDGVQAIATGRWTHVAAVKDGASVRLYVDGAQDGPVHSVPSGAPDANNGALYLGESPSNSDGSLHGSVEDLRIYDVALSESEIQASENLQLNGTEPGLVFYLPLNEAEGQNLTSLVPGASGGTLGDSGSLETVDPTWATDRVVSGVEEPAPLSPGASIHLELRAERMVARPGSAAFLVRSSMSGVADLEIYDVHGRRVTRLLSRAPVGIGSTRVQWDGSTDSSPRPASGLYLARLRLAGKTAVARITIAR